MTTTTNTSTDRIERQATLQAPLSRVWRALTVAEEFGKWFGVDLQGKSFAPGQSVEGPMDSSCGHITWRAEIAQMEPERLFSFRWHPYAMDPAADYSAEPTTLVEFRLEEREGGTHVRVVESGFDALPAARRELAFPKHEAGWEMQLRDLAEYVATT